MRRQRETPTAAVLLKRLRQCRNSEYGDDGWVRPMDLGGTDASSHSGLLVGLVKRGLVERKRRAGWIRPSYLYRISDQGLAALESR